MVIRLVASLGQEIHDQRILFVRITLPGTWIIRSQLRIVFHHFISSLYQLLSIFKTYVGFLELIIWPRRYLIRPVINHWEVNLYPARLFHLYLVSSVDYCGKLAAVLSRHGLFDRLLGVFLGTSIKQIELRRLEVGSQPAEVPSILLCQQLLVARLHLYPVVRRLARLDLARLQKCCLLRIRQVQRVFGPELVHAFLVSLNCALDVAELWWDWPREHVDLLLSWRVDAHELAYEVFLLLQRKLIFYLGLREEVFDVVCGRVWYCCRSLVVCVCHAL